MFFEEQKGQREFFSGLLIGAAIGAAIGSSVALLVAPNSGKRTRRKMIQQVVSSRDAIGDRVEDWADEIGQRLRRHKRLLRARRREHPPE
jgi:gas vesicle protein